MSWLQILQIDITFKNNNKRFSLMKIIATTNEMNIFLITQALMSFKSAEMIIWVFKQIAFNDIEYCLWQLHECIFDYERFSLIVILMNVAKGFSSTLEILKERGIWQFVRHLLCHWHIYRAIKRYYASLFKYFEKRK